MVSNNFSSERPISNSCHTTHRGCGGTPTKLAPSTTRRTQTTRTPIARRVLLFYRYRYRKRGGMPRGVERSTLEDPRRKFAHRARSGVKFRDPGAILRSKQVVKPEPPVRVVKQHCVKFQLSSCIIIIKMVYEWRFFPKLLTAPQWSPTGQWGPPGARAVMVPFASRPPPTGTFRTTVVRISNAIGLIMLERPIRPINYR
jgi:hypothetical protein